MKNPWEDINKPSKNEIKYLRINYEHPLDFMWGVDYLSRYLFIYEYSSTINTIIKDPPNLEGIETIKQTIDDNNYRMILVLKEKANWELFYALCNDIVYNTFFLKESSDATSTILKRLKRWQKFLRNNYNKILSEESIKGLIGELLFLKNHLAPKYGIGNSVKFWIGPEGYPQDFTVNDSAIEVKCQMGGAKPTIKISSIEQLETQLSMLYLYVITLGKTSNDNKKGINLPTLINTIEKEIELESPIHLDRFCNLLLELGYYKTDEYYNYNYILSKENMYIVNNDFPRIVKSEVRQGISNINYSIQLENCKDNSININNWEA